MHLNNGHAINSITTKLLHKEEEQEQEAKKKKRGCRTTHEPNHVRLRSHNVAISNAKNLEVIKALFVSL